MLTVSQKSASFPEGSIVPHSKKCYESINLRGYPTGMHPIGTPLRIRQAQLKSRSMTNVMKLGAADGLSKTVGIDKKIEKRRSYVKEKDSL